MAEGDKEIRSATDCKRCLAKADRARSSCFRNTVIEDFHDRRSAPRSALDTGDFGGPVVVIDANGPAAIPCARKWRNIEPDRDGREPPCRRQEGQPAVHVSSEGRREPRPIIRDACATSPAVCEHDARGESGSSLEGLDEVMTVIRLGLSKQLRQRLACSNAIENGVRRLDVLWGWPRPVCQAHDRNAEIARIRVGPLQASSRRKRSGDALTCLPLSSTLAALNDIIQVSVSLAGLPVCTSSWSVERGLRRSRLDEDECLSIALFYIGRDGGPV